MQNFPMIVRGVLVLSFVLALWGGIRKELDPFFQAITLALGIFVGGSVWMGMESFLERFRAPPKD